MHINKYLLGIGSIAIIGSIGWLSAGSLTISNSNFAKGFPIFKTIFFRSEGKDTINGSTNPESIRLDNGGIYTAVPAGLPGGGGNVLKLNGGRQIQMDPVVSDNMVDDAIGTSKIKNNSIINTNFADISITHSSIKNSSIEIIKFDPAITWPSGGVVFLTNNVCVGTSAIISVNNGTATCAPLPTGSGSGLPNCSVGQRPVYQSGAWICQTILLGGGGGDPYWIHVNEATGSNIPPFDGQQIWNKNLGNIGIGTQTPGSTLTVSGSMAVNGYADEQVYCYATDTWVPLGTYNPAFCAGCNPGYSYNPATQLCEQNSCLGTGTAGACGSAHGQTYASLPLTDLCNAGNTSPVGGNGPRYWSCNGTNGAGNASCIAYKQTTSGTGGSGGGAPIDNIRIQNAGGAAAQFNNLTVGGFRFYSFNEGSFPLFDGPANRILGTHNGVNPNTMEFSIDGLDGSDRCVYTYVNYPTPGCKNPTGYIDNFGGNLGTYDGIINHPKITSGDRIDIFLCGGICQ